MSDGTPQKTRDHLCPSVLQVLIAPLRGRPVQPVEIRHGQYPVTGRFSDDVGDKDEGMAAVKLAECGDIGGFVAVVDFLGDARDDLPCCGS